MSITFLKLIGRNPFYLRSKFLLIKSKFLKSTSRNPFYLRSKFLRHHREDFNITIVAIPSIWGLNSYESINEKFNIGDIVAIPSIWGLNSYKES